MCEQICLFFFFLMRIEFLPCLGLFKCKLQSDLGPIKNRKSFKGSLKFVFQIPKLVVLNFLCCKVSCLTCFQEVLQLILYCFISNLGVLSDAPLCSMRYCLQSDNAQILSNLPYTLAVTHEL